MLSEQMMKGRFCALFLCFFALKWPQLHFSSFPFCPPEDIFQYYNFPPISWERFAEKWHIDRHEVASIFYRLQAEQVEVIQSRFRHNGSSSKASPLAPTTELRLFLSHEWFLDQTQLIQASLGTLGSDFFTFCLQWDFGMS